MADSARRHNCVEFARNSSVERGPLRRARPCAGSWVRSAGGICCKKVPKHRGGIYAAEKQAAENKTGWKIHSKNLKSVMEIRIDGCWMGRGDLRLLIVLGRCC